MLAARMSSDCLNTRPRTTDTPVGCKGENKAVTIDECLQQTGEERTGIDSLDFLFLPGFRQMISYSQMARTLYMSVNIVVVIWSLVVLVQSLSHV